MEQIAKFFTTYWVVYFPTCIAFSTLPYFTYVDEILTFLLIGYTFMVKGRPGLDANPWKEFHVFLFILTAYVVYSLLWGENVAGGVFLEFIQQVRPYSIIYCTLILNPQLNNKQKNILLATTIITLIARTLIRNEGEGGQEDLSAGQMAMCAGMIWTLFKKDTRKHRYIAIFIVLFGLITGTKSKFIGEVVCFLGLTLFMRKKINVGSGKMLIYMMILGAIVLSFVWDKFDSYYVSGFNHEQRARSISMRVAYGQILWDYIPFGPGMGTFGSNGAWKYYSPLYYKYHLNHVWGLDRGGGFICDVFFPSLCQYGLVGIVLFLWFWKRRLKDINQIHNLKYFKVALMSFLCLLIEQTADSSILSGKGMGYCMIIAICYCMDRQELTGTRHI